MTNILVLNVGASSIKYSIFANLQKIESGKYEKLKSREDYKRVLIDILKNRNKKIKIDLIIHRVVHGGEIKKPTKINSEVKKQIKKFSELAPLHNPRQLIMINLAEKLNVPQYAVFDSSFFAELPEISRIYPINLKLTKKYGIRKYGFHGISHKSVSENLKGKTITCHIGDGVSMSAIKNGKPIDTTMGFTPLEGLMMGTRSGSIDSGIIFFLQKKGINAEKVLNFESGLKGISGYSDFRDLIKTMGKKESKLAYYMFVYKIAKQIGAYAVALRGLDNLVFTGEIGKNNSRIREEICKNLDILGIKIDRQKNKKNSELISSDNSKVKVYVRSPNEELEMVKEVLKILK